MVKTIFSSKSICATRVISTAAYPILISFSSLQTPGGSTGIWQSSSTTKEYEADVYGCGAVIGFGYTSSTITTAEFTW